MAAAIAGATGAFFSDSETSVGNTLAAGAIDLGIDNESYYNGQPNPGTSWQLSYDMDLCTVPNPAYAPDADENTEGTDDQPTLGCMFFNFNDLKPGDWGEDTISLHVNNNDSYLCADVTLTSTNDNGLTEPEGDDGDTTDGAGNGELQNYVKFVWWADDGDNVLEDNETPIHQNVPLGTGSVALADSDENIWGDEGPLPGDSTRYVGKAWCFGDLTLSPVPAGQGVNPTVNGGITCNGANVNNVSQTDSMTADISFRAVQSRNNTSFQCTAPDVVERATVGANLSAYVAPSVCDVTATGIPGPLETIQEAVDAAAPGDTVCVTPGSYEEIVNVDKSVTIAGLGVAGSAVTDAFIINADSVTVKGFNVEGGLTEGTFAGFYIKSGVDTLTIRDNDIEGPAVNDAITSGGSRGIVNVSGVPISAILVENNTIHQWTSGIYTNPDTGAGITWTIRMNDIDDNVAGIGELNSALVSRNEFGNSGIAQEAIGTGPTYDAISLISENNFLNGTMINDYGAAAMIGAENNFFNVSGLSQTTVGEVDFTPEEVSAFPHN